jgi:hypothetical protein
MEDYVKTMNITSEGTITEEVWNAIKTRLDVEERIQYKKVRSDQLNISFPSYLYGSDYILKLLKESGFHKKAEDKKSPWKKFLKLIIKGNKEAYGDMRLDCCKLNN